MALAVLTLAALAACGSPTPPDGGGVVTITGSIELPTGHGVNLAGLTVSTPLGIYPVTASGDFEADIYPGATTEIGVETAAGELILLGVATGRTVDVSLASTAEALLYYAVGGMWLPPAQQDTVRSLLANVPEVDTLATELQRQLTAGGNGVAAPDQAMLDALEGVHASLIGHAQVTALWAASSGALRPASEPDSNIIINPSSGTQAGVEVLHDPAGAGVVAQNHFRRPAALLVYETGWDDASDNLNENVPPVPVATVDVPATGQLEFFEALLDIVTADSPWSPVLSESVNLPDRAGAKRTHYQLVVVGPSGTDVTLPIMDDPRFDIFHGHWEDVELDKTIELFLDELLLPLVEVAGLGARAYVDASKLNELRRRTRLIHDEHLAGLGVLLKNRQTGLVDGLRYAINELIENRNLRLDLLDAVGDALREGERNRLAFEAAERRLSSRANASSIAAAVETLLVGGDVAKIAYDLAGAPSVVDWTAVASPALFVLQPRETTVTKYYSSARLSVRPTGASNGNYLYRWTNSADFGSISDLLEEDTVLTTTEPEIWYFHDDPAHIHSTDVDTVTVEVFEVEAGATSVPPGALPIARMVATIRGDDRELAAGLTFMSGLTQLVPDFGIDEAWPCTAMYLRIPSVAGATSYNVDIRGMSVPGHHQANSNKDLKSGRTDYSRSFGVGNVRPWVDACKWRTPDGAIDMIRPDDFRMFHNAAGNEYLLSVFAIVENDHWVSMGWPSGAEAMRLWLNWFAGASVTVVPEF